LFEKKVLYLKLNYLKKIVFQMYKVWVSGLEHKGVNFSGGRRKS
jgi:hypothetical protein